VPPTRRRVRRMLAATARQPQEVLGLCPPSYERLTVERLAVCAVMAGCRPVHFRIVIAATEAALEQAFGLHGVSATTMGATPAIVVGGPARHECKVNMMHGVGGSGTRANATVCRALKLAVQNVGKAQLGGTESTTIGSPNKYGFCIAEWEERCPAWAPLRTQEDPVIPAEESAVTVLATTGGPIQFTDRNFTSDQLLSNLARSMSYMNNPFAAMMGDCLLILSPEHYDTLLAGGIESKAALRQSLFEKSTLKFGEKTVPKFASPAAIHVVVAGGPAGKFSAFMPCFGGGPTDDPLAVLHRPQSRRIDAALPVAEELPLAPDDEVLVDPRSDSQRPPMPLAVRASALQAGDVVALIDISKYKSDELVDALERQFRSAYPDVELRRYVKPTFTRPCPDELRAKIAKECRYVVEALAD